MKNIILKLDFFKPIRENVRFFLFMYVLGMVAAICTVAHSSRQQLYDNAWVETFFDVYALCVILMLFPVQLASKGWLRHVSLRGIVRAVFYSLAYTVSLIDVYCMVKFDAAINPSILMLVGETDPREASEFLSSYLSLDILFTNVGWILLILLIHIISNFIHFRCPYIGELKRVPYGKQFISVITLAVVVLTFSLSYTNYKNLSGLLSQKTIGDVEHYLTTKHRGIQYLPLYRITFSINANRLAAHQVAVLREVVDHVSVDSCSFTSPNIVLIIGEAYNKYHSQLYGYTHPTTPRQLKMRDSGNLVVYDDVVSPWNLTSYVFKHIMSTYVVGDKGDWCDYPLFGTIFRKAGYNVAFLTNEFLPKAKQAVYDFSGGFFLNDTYLSEAQFDVRNQQLHIFDEGILKEYDSMFLSNVPEISENTNKGNLTIFHLIGQHVEYRVRYPQRQKHFTADDYPERTDLKEKWKKNLAHYDNATLYNDSIVGEIVKRFEGTNTIILYMPDHGEEVHSPELPHYYGRMHSAGINRRLAREEFGVPFWIYATPEYQKKHPEMWKQVKSSHSKRYMTDALPHLLMYLAGIHTPYYRDTLNILSPSYNEKRPRIVKHQVDYDKVTGNK